MPGSTSSRLPSRLAGGSSLVLAAILAWLGYPVLPADVLQDQWGYTTGRGASPSSVLSTWGPDRLRLQAACGAGIASCRNDASHPLAPPDGGGDTDHRVPVSAKIDFARTG
jgi:hypothetical protein